MLVRADEAWATVKNRICRRTSFHPAVEVVFSSG